MGVSAELLRRVALSVVLGAALGASWPGTAHAQEVSQAPSSTRGAEGQLAVGAAEPASPGDGPRLPSKEAVGLSFLAYPLAALTFGSHVRFASIAAGAGLGAEYRFPFLPYLGVAAVADYRYLPLTDEVAVRFLSARGRIVGYLGLAPRLLGSLGVGAGYAGGSLSGPVTSAPLGALYLSGTLRVDWLLRPSLAPYAGLEYEECWSLYRSVGLQLGVKLTPHLRPAPPRTREAPPASPELRPVPAEREGGQGAVRVELSDVRFEAVYPVLYRSYENRPVGSAVLRNQERDTIRNVVLALFVEGYMNHPRLTLLSDELRPRQSVSVDLRAWFDERMLSVPAAEQAPVRMTLSYDLDGERREVGLTAALPVQSANAVPPRDIRAVGAFVTPADPPIRGLAGLVNGWIDPARYEAADENLKRATLLYETLALAGIRVTHEDSGDLRSEPGGSSPSVRTLQFPRATLESGGGSAVDLAVLYASLLEASGVESALIIGPGGALAAFALASTEATEVEEGGLPRERVFPRDGRAWVPVQVDQPGGFLRAVQAAADRWRELSANRAATFVEVRESWRSYTPAQPPGAAPSRSPPAREQVVQAYTREIEELMLQAVAPQLAELTSNAPAGADARSLANRIGVLYARHGLYDRAEQQFTGIEGAATYVPALVNLGHIALLRGDLGSATSYYERAQAVEPKDQLVLLALTRLHYELGDYGMARGLYAQLREINALLADSYSFLAREKPPAARAGTRRREPKPMLWAEE